MGGAGEARVVAADGHLHPVEHALGELVGLDILPGRQVDGPVHGQVIVLCGHDDVGLADGAAGPPSNGG